jgi:ABC-type sugar transport system permease subunit
MRNGQLVGKTSLGGGASKLLPFLLLLPALVFIAVLYIYPLVRSIWGSFSVGAQSLSLGNYAKAWALYKKDIIFTIRVAVLGTILSVAVGLILACYVRLSTSRASRFVNFISRLAIFLPYVILGQMMRSFLAPHGLFNVILANLGIVNLNNPLQFFNIRGLLLGFLWKEAPFIAFITLSSLQVIDNSYLEAARSVGAKTRHIILYILIPMVKPAVAMAAVLTFCTIISTFTLPYMLVTESPTMVTVDIAHRVTYFRDYGVANALGVCLYLLAAPMAVYYLRRTVREEIYGY